MASTELTCKNNFVISIQKILSIEKKLSNKQSHLQEWLPL